MASDWVKLHRKLLDSQIFTHSGILRLWIYCITTANWRDSAWIIPGTLTEITVKRGQFITGRESLFERLYGGTYKGDDRPVSRTLWRWLEFLEKSGCVVLQNVSNRCTLVTVVKYDEYQSADGDYVQPRDQPVSNQCPTGVQPRDQPVSTIEEDKNSIKGRKGRSKEALAERESPDPELVDWLQWWNKMHAKGYVPHSTNAENPPQTIVAAWRRAKGSSELKPLLANREAIAREIAASPFCSGSWFRFEKMISGKNSDKEWVLRKLLDGGYREKQGRLALDPRGNMSTVENYLATMQGENDGDCPE